MSNSLYLAALAVAALQDLDVVGTRPPLVVTDDHVTGGVLDSRGRTWRVRCPRNSQAATAIEAEAALAPFLLEELRRGSLPFDIIRPAGFAQSEFGRTIVFPEPFGGPVSWADMSVEQGRELGRMIAAIHTLPVEIVNNAGLPVYAAEEWRSRLVTELNDVDAASPLPPVLKRRWMRALEDPKTWSFEPTVVHGDIDAENFLWSGGGVATILGFGEAKVADPALDLSPFLSLEEEVYTAVIESYENTLGRVLDDACYARMMLMSEIAIARWLMHGIRTRNPDIQEEARAMLDDLKVQIEADPELSGPSWNVVPEDN